MTAAAAEEIDPTLLNWRRVEAGKVWNRGYRGRPDRTLALTDSGVSSAHPELGPWNGVNIEKSGEGITLRTAEEKRNKLPVLESELVKSVGPFEGQLAGTSTNEPDGSDSSTDGTTDGSSGGTTDGTTDTTVDTDGTLRHPSCPHR